MTVTIFFCIDFYVVACIPCAIGCGCNGDAVPLKNLLGSTGEIFVVVREEYDETSNVYKCCYERGIHHTKFQTEKFAKGSVQYKINLTIPELRH